MHARSDFKRKKCKLSRLRKMTNPKSIMDFLLELLGAPCWFYSLTVSQTLKGSSRLKGFHTLGWRAFAAGGCAGAERGRRILAFPDRTARLTVLLRSPTRSYPESHLPPSSCEVSPASFVLRGLTSLLRPARSHLPPSSCETHSTRS